MARVLVVDDEEPITQLLSAILTRHGHVVSTARSGRTASEMLKPGAFDLVVSDIFMPDGTGVELLTEMRMKKIDIGFIGMSGGHLGLFSPFAKALGSLGATATLRKPFSAAELLDAIESILANRETQS